jgi:hypothetical protein
MKTNEARNPIPRLVSLSDRGVRPQWFSRESYPSETGRSGGL